MVAENLKHLQGEIKGPPDTPFEGIFVYFATGMSICSIVCLFTGATFILDILIPDNYPFNPPKVFHAFNRIFKKLYFKNFVLQCHIP